MPHENPRISAVPGDAPRPLALAAILLLIAAGMWVNGHFSRRGQARPEKSLVPEFTVPVGAVRAPLPFRIVSFHRGRADKDLVKLAAQLGFNEVQFQIEGSNESGIRDFAAYDGREHIVDYCHSLGMKVTVWVHELSDLPAEGAADYLGPVTTDNAGLWELIDKRYEWMLREAVPNVDGLVLTCVETQVNATDTQVLLKLVGILDEKCRRHHKSLVVRTFVWQPEDLDSVMAAIAQMPADVVVMSKAVPQDWQMRGANAAEIGAVGERPQIVEYDAAGEYFLNDNAANCMVDKLKTQFDYGMSKGAAGICVRVDRFDASVLWTPNEVNVWALGLMAAGVTDNAEEIWRRWAEYRYGKAAAPAVIAALRHTPEVVEEMLSMGPFTYGDTRGGDKFGVPRYTVWLPYWDVLGEYKISNLNWQMWRWDASLVEMRDKMEAGDAAVIEDLRQRELAAARVADDCLAELEKARAVLSMEEYAILRTRLLTNKVQLAFRSAATMAALHYRQAMHAWREDDGTRMQRAMEEYRADLKAVQKVADSLAAYPPAETLEYRGKTWEVNAPLAISREELEKWVKDATW